MEAKSIVQSLAALAHESRLAVFRALVQAGLDGMPAGHIATLLDVPPSSLSFHLKELAHAGLVQSRHLLARFGAALFLSGARGR